MPGKQNGCYAQERKRNMTTLIPQFKIKYSLKQGEFVKVAYANFFKQIYRPGIKNTMCERKVNNTTEWRHFC